MVYKKQNASQRVHEWWAHYMQTLSLDDEATEYIQLV